MEICGEVELHAMYVEQFSPKFSGKERSRLLIICLGSLRYFTMFLKNNRAASFAVQPAVAGMKVAYFENLSTMTMIIQNRSDFNKEVMKSIVTLSHGYS